MEVSKSLRRSIELMGISQRIRVRFYVFSIIYAIVIVNMAYFLVERWQDIDDRINALKAMVFLSTFIGYAMVTANYWQEFSSMLAILKDSTFKVPYPISREREEIMRGLEAKCNRFNGFWLTMLAAYTMATALMPVIIVAVRVVFFSAQLQRLINETYSAPFPLYYPHFARGSAPLMGLVYAVGYGLQATYAAYTCLSGHVANVTPLTAMAHVEFELRLVALSLDEMDGVLAPTVHQHPQRFLKYFVRHHQEACRKLQTVNKGIRWTAATVNTTASLYICMSIYIIVQKSEMVSKVQEVTLLGVWAYAVYLLDSCGETIKAEGERLRNKMYACSWLDKPKRFRTAMLVALTRTSKSMDVKPFGLFALNLSSFAMTMNAAYSYYNLLYKFKNT